MMLAGCYPDFGAGPALVAALAGSSPEFFGTGGGRE
jgi:hypothetical protein